MVQLADGDIKTREVLDWKGVHVFHFAGSSCSQKVRIFLNLKGIPWESHPVDIHGNENFRERYLGINPRGLLPTMVLDGAVHIESNDILAELEKNFPEPKLIPAGRESEITELLEHENDLHLDLRTLSFRFAFGRNDGPPKPAAALETYRNGGSGTVQGQPDANKDREIKFWEWATAEGFTDEACRASALKFQTAYDELDKTLADNDYLMGDALSVVDIAWYIYTSRLAMAGYPFERLHPHVEAWRAKLHQQPEFAEEIQGPPGSEDALAELHKKHEQEGATLAQVAGI
jgi:glutathione S-transferase